MSSVRLHVNIDHVATLRQARGCAYPDPVAAATLCELAGADGITVHRLRKARRPWRACTHVVMDARASSTATACRRRRRTTASTAATGA